MNMQVTSFHIFLIVVIPISKFHRVKWSFGFKFTELFCMTDDFYVSFDVMMAKYTLNDA